MEMANKVVGSVHKFMTSEPIMLTEILRNAVIQNKKIDSQIAEEENKIKAQKKKIEEEERQRKIAEEKLKKEQIDQEVREETYNWRIKSWEEAVENLSK